MYEKLEECPSCSHPKFNNFKICIDHATSKESFALVKCSKCQLVFTNPRPTKDYIAKYYDSSNYISHSNKTDSPVNFIYKIARRKALFDKKELIKKYTPGRTVLDYGCGTGHFLEYMQRNKWTIQGYEPNENAAESAEKLLGNTIHKDRSEIKETEKFSIITAWHVIEHVHDIRETLKFLRKRLATEGFLFIAVPNINSYDANYYKEFWAAYDVPRHLYHFSQDTFNRLAKSLKFNVIDVVPMKMDAYYVSLLSEKYKGSKDYLIEGIKKGHESNKQAKYNGEYSSLIFVLSK